MGNDRENQDERIARAQRLLDRLEAVQKQAADLSRMASELRDEAAESIRLAVQTAPVGLKTLALRRMRTTRARMTNRKRKRR